MRQTFFGYVCVALAASLFVGSPAAAQNAGGADNGPLNVIATDSGPQKVNLLVGKARILRLSKDARDVLVADPAVADVVIRTPRLIYVLGRRVGSTNVVFFDAQGNEMLWLSAHVEVDLSTLRDALKKYLPKEDVHAESVNQNIVLTGTVSSPKAAEDAARLAGRFVPADANIVNMIDIAASQQVVLRVRIAEMERNAIKQLGANLLLDKQFESGDSVGFAVDTLLPVAIGALASAAGPVLFGTTVSTDSGFRFQALFDALETNGLVKTLAEPNLTALSGETANFLAGGEFPIPVAQGDDSFTVVFKPFGIGLDFTPVVLSSGRINLHLSSEVSSLSNEGAVSLPGGFTVSAVAVRRAATTVELPDGGSLVIAGLLEDNILETIRGVPGIKDIPILGTLFRSVEFQRKETELVIAVTVNLVKPVDPQHIVLPTDGFAPASDIDMYLFGRLHATYTGTANLPSLAELKAPTGYIME